MSKSDKIEQILKDNNIDHVKVVPQGEIILEQISQPTRTILQDTGDEEFNSEKLINNISPEFWIPQGQVKEPSNEMLLNIKKLAIKHHIWEVPCGHLKVSGITFFAEYREPQSLHEAISKYMTTYIPEYQIVACDDWVTFILPKDKIQSLLLAMDFTGDEIKPFTSPVTEHRNPTLDRE